MKRNLGWALPFALLLLATLANQDVMLVVKSYVDLLSMGYSFSKTALLLLFLTVLAGSRSVPTFWRPQADRFLIFGLLLLHGLALIEHWLFVRAVDLPWSAQLMAVDNGRFTTTSPLHLHEPKAALAWLTGYQGDQWDSAFAFLPYLPKALVALHAVLILAMALAGFFSVQQFSKHRAKGATLSLALAVFAAIKASVDGGPLSPEAILPLPWILGLLYGDRWLRISGALTVPALALSLWAFGGDPLFAAFKLLGAVGLLSTPLAWDLHKSGRSVVPVTLAAALTLSAPWLAFALSPRAQHPPMALGTLRYLHHRLEAGKTAFLHHREPLPRQENLPYTVVRSARADTLVISEITLSRSTTTRELLEGVPNNPQHHPVTWAPGYQGFEFEGRFPNSALDNWTPNSFVNDFRVEKLQGNRTRISLSLKPGATIAVAVDSLPKGNFVLSRVRNAQLDTDGKLMRNRPGRGESRGHGAVSTPRVVPGG